MVSDQTWAWCTVLRFDSLQTAIDADPGGDTIWLVTRPYIELHRVRN